MHNASTFSPGGTCGAIPSRPLRRRSWCALLRLRAGRAPDTVDAGRSRKGGDLALLRRTSGGRGGPGGRASRRAGSTRPNFFPAVGSLEEAESKLDFDGWLHCGQKQRRNAAEPRTGIDQLSLLTSCADHTKNLKKALDLLTRNCPQNTHTIDCVYSFRRFMGPLRLRHNPHVKNLCSLH